MPSPSCCSTWTSEDASRWERAYQAFETPAQERRKFRSRLRSIGAEEWPKHWRIIEIFSGRGSGLDAWRDLGFDHVVGLDRSAALLFTGSASGLRIQGDARSIPLLARSIDAAVVQGGLHHLSSTIEVEQVVREMARIVRANGVVVVIEPWMTPFLSFVHAVVRLPLARRLSRKIDSLAVMIEEERATYERWLGAPDETLAVLRSHLKDRRELRRWGKLVIVGTPAHVDA